MSVDLNAHNRLIVEGKDDHWSIIHLMKRHRIDWESTDTPYVYPIEGIDNVRKSIDAALKTYERLGYVIDADADLPARWAQMRDRFRKAGIETPEEIPETGFVTNPRGFARLQVLGVWVMPNNKTTGTLEDFLATLVPKADPCWQHALEATKQAISLGASLRHSDTLKGQLHTWLAWQETPGRPFGTAIKAAVLGHDSPEALLFVNWFRRLFEAAPG